MKNEFEKHVKSILKANLLMYLGEHSNAVEDEYMSENEYYQMIDIMSFRDHMEEQLKEAKKNKYLMEENSNNIIGIEYIKKIGKESIKEIIREVADEVYQEETQ